MRYDIAIVGDGPAGLADSINAKIRNKNIILFGSGSDKLAKAPSIDNYLGVYDVSGSQLKDKFMDHVTKMGIEITYERVNNVYSMGDYFALAVGDKTYEATTVIMATGVQYGKMIKGEEEYLGKGVGYCATCDAGLYRDKIVAIIGYNHEGEEDANFLSEIASKVYYIPIYNLNNTLDSSIEIINDNPIEIQGEKLVNKLILKERKLDVDGVFLITDSVSPS